MKHTIWQERKCGRGVAYVKMAATTMNVEEIRTRVILEEFGVKNVSVILTVVL